MTRPLLLVMLSALAAFAAAPVFPTPKSLVSGPSPASRITILSTAAIDPEFKPVLRAFLDDWGFSLAGTGRKLTIKRNPNLKEEEYRLNYGAVIILEASTPAGVAWGLQTGGWPWFWVPWVCEANPGAKAFRHKCPLQDQNSV